MSCSISIIVREQFAALGNHRGLRFGKVIEVAHMEHLAIVAHSPIPTAGSGVSKHPPHARLAVGLGTRTILAVLLGGNQP